MICGDRGIHLLRFAMTEGRTLVVGSDSVETEMYEETKRCPAGGCIVIPTSNGIRVRRINPGSLYPGVRRFISPSTDDVAAAPVLFSLMTLGDPPTTDVAG